MTFFGKAITALPGDLFVGSMNGLPGLGVELGEILNGNPFRAIGWALDGKPDVAQGVHPPWRYKHAGIYIGNKTVVEAEPHGARRRTFDQFSDGGMKYVLWSTGLFPDLTPEQREKIVAAAESAAPEPPAKGVGYSVLDYFWLAGHHFGLGGDELRHYIANSGHMICSQLADWCYQQAPYKLFDDGRWNGDVTPADLAGNFIARARKLKLI